MDKNLKKIGFALSNQGLMDEIEAEIRLADPKLSDKKVIKERNKILKKMTLFSDKNKKAKKPKKDKS